MNKLILKALADDKPVDALKEERDRFEQHHEEATSGILEAEAKAEGSQLDTLIAAIDAASSWCPLLMVLCGHLSHRQPSSKGYTEVRTRSSVSSSSSLREDRPAS